MADVEQPQIYLVTPAEFDLSHFSNQLAQVLDTHDVACVRLTMASQDEDKVSKAADTLREIAHTRDVALVIDSHIVLAERLGLDGVHLRDAARTVRHARKILGADAIVGSYCAASRHDGMSAAEAGADYVSFGPIGETPLGDGTVVDHEILQWWSEMIEVPVVAEGALTLDLIRKLAPITDFFAIGDEIWAKDDPIKELGVLKAGFI